MAKFYMVRLVTRGYACLNGLQFPVTVKARKGEGVNYYVSDKEFAALMVGTGQYNHEEANRFACTEGDQVRGWPFRPDEVEVISEINPVRPKADNKPLYWSVGAVCFLVLVAIYRTYC